MFDTLIRFALRRRLFMTIVYTGLIAWGITSVYQLPVDVLPDLNRPRVTVFVEAEGLGTEEVEKIVTQPLERSFITIPGVIAVRSSSAQSLSVINIEFDWGSKNSLNRQQIFERLQSVTLPENVHTSVAPETALLGEIMWIGLTSDDPKISQADLRNIAETTLRQTITGIPGVSNILVMGGTPKQYTIFLDPSRLSTYGIGVDTLEKSLNDITNPGGAGVIIQPLKELPVTLRATPPDIREIENISIGSDITGQNRILGDVGYVKEGAGLQLRGDALIDGKPGVIVRISKIPNVNTLELTRTIEQQLTDIKILLPKNVQLYDGLFKQSWFIEKGLENVQRAFIDAGIIVGIVVILFLMNVRTVMVTLISLPITLLLTAIVFKLSGIGINIMTLGGITIAIGELVDDAIVDMENIYRRLSENAGKIGVIKQPWMKVIFDASVEVRGSVVYATTLQLIVFIPFLMLPGIDGKLLAPIGIAYIISMLMSLLTAVTVVPILCSWLFPKWIEKHAHDGHKNTWLVGHIKKRAQKLIDWSLNHPQRALLFALLTIPITVIMYVGMSSEGLPSFNESSFTVGITTKPGSSLQYTKNIVQEVSKKIQKIPGIVSSAAILGRASADAHAQGSNNAEIEISLEDNITTEKKGAVQNAINTILKEYNTSAVFSIGQPITHRVEEIISGIRAPLVIKVYGEDLNVLESIGKNIVAIGERVEGVTNINLEPQTKVPSISVRPKNGLSTYGVPYNDIKNVIEVAIGGKEVARVIDGQISYPVVLTFDPFWNSTITNLGGIPYRSENGTRLTLGSLIDISSTETRNIINHDDGKRRIVISGFTQGRSIVDIVNEIKTSIKQSPVPSGYTVSYEGLYKAQKESFRLLTLIGVVVILALASVLYWHFGSFKLVGQIFLDIVTGWLGGMIGVWLSGGIISTAHLVGFIALMGIVARNGIMLIDHYKHLALENSGVIDKKTVIRGSLERVIPVSMTALSALVGLLPLVLGSGEAGKEMLSPIATVIFWGLLVSTLIELAIRPGIFFHYSRHIFEKQKISSNKIVI